ncbi:MAG TPA: tripartite tricarboxylate transporter substrate binding protein [Burkholderiales bacterium]|nr:tripartite tricarboxylate transporter substrate binding protein [Burkholderiales bacterium]
MLRHPLTAAALAAALLLPCLSWSQSYPSRPVRIVVAYAPGGSTDLAARLIADEVMAAQGWRIVVDNRAGGGTLIGTETVARAAPDGYTLFYGTNAMIINSVLKEKIPYDPIRDFAPVSLVITQPLGVLVGPRLKVASMKDLIAHAKSNPGKLNFASSGNGSLQHIAGEMLRNTAGLNIVHVPYKGAGPAMIDLLAGNVDFMITSLLGTSEHIKAGRLRLVAVTSGKRSPAVPEVPTVAEAGLPGYEAISWQALFAPAKTPKPIIDRWNAVLQQAARSKKLQDRVAENGMELRMAPPSELRELVVREQKKYAGIVKRTGAKVE